MIDVDEAFNRLRQYVRDNSLMMVETVEAVDTTRNPCRKWTDGLRSIHA